MRAHWGSDIPWFTFISHTVGRGRGLLGDKGYRLLLGLCGVSLAALGLIYLRDGFMVAPETQV